MKNLWDIIGWRIDIPQRGYTGGFHIGLINDPYRRIGRIVHDKYAK